MPDNLWSELDGSPNKKKFGANAIRTAHNPPAPELLELFRDRLVDYKETVLDAADGQLTWTLKATNNGEDPATGVTIVDPLPAGLERRGVAREARVAG